MTEPLAAGGRVAAFFDLDGTLIPGSANIPLAKAAFKAGFVNKRELAVDLARNLSFMLIGASDDRSAEVRDRILRGVSGREASEIEALADNFLGDLVATINPAVQVILDEHRSAGHDLVLVSASPTEIVQRFAVAAGMDYGRGTTGERDADGRYTGKLAGPFCYKEGKAEVLRTLAAEHGYDMAASFAYSDSISDSPMMLAVGNPIAVNPDHDLRVMAIKGGWPIVETGQLRGTVETVRSAIRKASRGLGGGWRRRAVTRRQGSGAATIVEERPVED